ncbi:MAG: resuscitation-promoting factor RpfB [Solirubrobacteraceae bacterium]|nr:resuscitation-promoting factor RpfB [Solirubrobacteraceae bacterium]
MGIERDLSSPLPWRRSLRASRERRGVRARRRRLAFRGRAGVTLAVAMTAVAATGALAQSPAPPDGGGGSAAANAPAGGASVAAIQRALGLPADGVYGKRTRAAVRRFQRRQGLTVDGVAGPETLAALGLSGAGDSGSATGVADSSNAGGGSAPDAATSAKLERIAQCESGGDTTAVSADGQYRGKYQFDRATWERLGGTGDPAKATEAEQDRLAAKLLAESGTSPWPVCA